MGPLLPQTQQQLRMVPQPPPALLRLRLVALQTQALLLLFISCHTALPAKRLSTNTQHR
jgi:hypothetical protein